MTLMPDRAQFPDTVCSAMSGLKVIEMIRISAGYILEVDRFPYLICIAPCHHHEKQKRSGTVQNNESKLSLNRCLARDFLLQKSTTLCSLFFRDRGIDRIQVIPFE